MRNEKSKDYPFVKIQIKDGNLVRFKHSDFSATVASNRIILNIDCILLLDSFNNPIKHNTDSTKLILSIKHFETVFYNA